MYIDKHFLLQMHYISKIVCWQEYLHHIALHSYVLCVKASDRIYCVYVTEFINIRLLNTLVLIYTECKSKLINTIPLLKVRKINIK